MERLRFLNYEYAPRHNEQMNVAERYWLNSGGSFIRYKENLPLLITQNGQKLCLITKHSRHRKYEPSFVVGVGRDAKEAHISAILDHFRERNPYAWYVPPQFRQPIWSTGARFGKDVNETSLLQLSDELTQYGYDRGVILIDNGWEECYGTLAFDKQKFPNAKNVIDALKARGFFISLLIHPFVNAECTDLYNEGRRNQYVIDR